MHKVIVALVLSLWHAYAPGLEKAHDARVIAGAIATVILDAADDAAEGGEGPVFGSFAEDAAVMALFAARESSLNLSIAGDGGRSHGAWQLQLPEGRGNAVTQGFRWYRLLRDGKRLCPRAPAAIMWGGCNVAIESGESDTSARAARARVRRARELMVMVLFAR